MLSVFVKNTKLLITSISCNFKGEGEENHYQSIVNFRQHELPSYMCWKFRVYKKNFHMVDFFARNYENLD